LLSFIKSFCENYLKGNGVRATMVFVLMSFSH
jgi:hypothetical protein